MPSTVRPVPDPVPTVCPAQLGSGLRTAVTCKAVPCPAEGVRPDGALCRQAPWPRARLQATPRAAHGAEAESFSVSPGIDQETHRPFDGSVK